MKPTSIILLAIASTASQMQAQNLLLNGDFNSSTSGAPTDWSTWTFGGGYANQEVLTPNPGVAGNYDGTLQMTLGAANTSGGGGVYQIISANAGLDYTLSVDAGAQDWWLPTGEIRLFFFDASNNQLALTQIDTTDGIHSPDQYDVGVPYQAWSLSALAPAGTVSAKVEFAGYGGGSTWFDNADLTVQDVPEPCSIAALTAGLGLLLTVQIRRNKHTA